MDGWVMPFDAQDMVTQLIAAVRQVRQDVPGAPDPQPRPF
jgi:hypothetical protein